MKNFNSNKGFTVIELLVSASILIIIFSFVLANFRTGQYSGEIDTVTKQTIESISTIRVMALGGQKIVDPASPADKIYPLGGFGISFDINNPSQLVLFADFDADGIYDDGTGPDPNEIIPNGLIKFSNVNVIQLCEWSLATVDDLPCGTWTNIGLDLNIIFPVPGQVKANAGSFDLNGFVGGVYEHQRTGQQSYFYVSLTSGLVTGGQL